MHAFIEDHYDVTYYPAHLSRKLREAGMNYAQPRPMDHAAPTIQTRFSPSASPGAR
ncbi:hypothetical protein EA462_02235 [Natrarchaeobius halalkaliphilus]|uniref:Uncharacterized protein n=1 Tax=Natrarchaeobius halalkaliphilus TaxID=1679091 RepID=A0A3N6MC36_9EURY|nr:hypothetical protein EA462_02235 [Natrarchaeobius halalkaliphilus]